MLSNGLLLERVGALFCMLLLLHIKQFLMHSPHQKQCVSTLMSDSNLRLIIFNAFRLLDCLSSGAVALLYLFSCERRQQQRV